jgi:hypothetical protein
MGICSRQGAAVLFSNWKISWMMSVVVFKGFQKFFELRMNYVIRYSSLVKKPSLGSSAQHDSFLPFRLRSSSFAAKG